MWQAGNSLAASPLANSLAGFAREGNWRLRRRSPAHASRQLRRLQNYETQLTWFVFLDKFGLQRVNTTCLAPFYDVHRKETKEYSAQTVTLHLHYVILPLLFR